MSLRGAHWRIPRAHLERAIFERLLARLWGSFQTPAAVRRGCLSHPWMASFAVFLWVVALCERDQDQPLRHVAEHRCHTRHTTDIRAVHEVAATVLLRPGCLEAVKKTLSLLFAPTA